MPTYEDYAFAERRYQETEARKVPGQKFCDTYGWRLHNDYNEIQRPDKITYMDGSVYRTHTPTTHVWYQNKQTHSHHVWIEFRSESSFCVKTGINVTVKQAAGFNKYSLIPNPDYYEDCMYFYDGQSVVNYLLRIKDCK